MFSKRYALVQPQLLVLKQELSQKSPVAYIKGRGVKVDNHNGPLLTLKISIPAIYKED